MSRVLVIVAAIGFAMALICFAGVGLVGGFAWHGHNAWRWGPDWRIGWRHGDWSQAVAGPAISRDYPWSGGDTLRIEAPADVEYTQGPVARVTATGPKGMLDRLTVRDGRIAFDGWVNDAPTLKIVMTAPDVTRFESSGSQNLSIANYKQDELTISVTGSGDVVAKGEARRTDLKISGSGDADLGGLTGDEADVRISGSGDARIAPKASADVHISGSGDVTVLTNPPNLTSEVSCSGTVTRAGVKETD
jgi:hypothetical protein